MVRTFCSTGEKEILKGAFHGAGGMLAALMAAYNIVAWCYRRERHLGVNAIVYTAATLWEVKQTTHHFERCVDKRSARRLTLVTTDTEPPVPDITQAA